MGRNISSDLETEALIAKLFSHGQFSDWVKQKVREEAAIRLKLASDPKVKAEISDMTERAVSILTKNWGGERTTILAQRWEAMIKERGGVVSAEQLIKKARDRRDE